MESTRLESIRVESQPEICATSSPNRRKCSHKSSRNRLQGGLGTLALPPSDPRRPLGRVYRDLVGALLRSPPPSGEFIETSWAPRASLSRPRGRACSLTTSLGRVYRDQVGATPSLERVLPDTACALLRASSSPPTLIRG